MMKCGHAANATHEGKPVCVICFMVGPFPEYAKEIDDTPPDLTGRMATCSYETRADRQPCTSREPSSTRLAFFSYRPDKPTDEFYCGCWGWD